MRIVARTEVKLRPSRRASRYGRTASPGRAGSSALIAKPITVARNAMPNPAPPIGRNRNCHRTARKTYTSAMARTEPDDRDGVGPAQLGPDRPQVGAPQEERQQRDGHDEDETGAELWPHGDSVI